jgi:hypothetical protein
MAVTPRAGLDAEPARLLLAERRQRRVATAEDETVGVVGGLPVSGEEQGQAGHMRIVSQHA